MYEGIVRGSGLNILLSVFTFTNLGFIISYMIGQNWIFYKKNSPRLVAAYALLLTIFLIIYFLLIAAIVLYGIIKHQYLTLLLSVFIALPFVLGKKATYETLNLYSNLQLLSLFISLFYALLLIIKNY